MAMTNLNRPGLSPREVRPVLVIDEITLLAFRAVGVMFGRADRGRAFLSARRSFRQMLECASDRSEFQSAPS
jgi:hypothetical protein